jgi:hypothetical protein
MCAALKQNVPDTRFYQVKMMTILPYIMDKKDVMYGVAAVIIILVMALVVKPVMTGHPVNTGIPVQVTATIVRNETGAPVINPIWTPDMRTQTPKPTPVPTWNKSVQAIGFVNSSMYGVSLTEAIPNGTRFDNLPQNTSMTSFAKINGRFSGTTQVIKIPFPYWELVYTVDPVAETKPSTIAVTPTKGSGVAYSGVQGSFSGSLPEFTIQVMDAEDPNRIVRVISPPGGIDVNLWKGVKGTINPAVTVKAGRATNSADTPVTDPRPWTEKFFEGQRSYYFIINSQQLNSYSIDIRVPSRYIGTV